MIRKILNWIKYHFTGVIIKPYTDNKIGSRDGSDVFRRYKNK